MSEMAPRHKLPLYCNFCAKEEQEVYTLVAGPMVFICDECIELAADVVAEKRKADAALAPSTVVPGERK